MIHKKMQGRRNIQMNNVNVKSKVTEMKSTDEGFLKQQMDSKTKNTSFLSAIRYISILMY